MCGKKIRSIIAGYILAMAAVYGEPSLLQVYGAESSVIENVSVILSDNYGEPEEILEPTIKINGTNCVLEDFQYRTDLEKWKPGKKVRIEITVKADKEKIFPISLNSSQCKVSGASFVSARALEDSKLQVKVDYKPVCSWQYLMGRMGSYRKEKGSMETGKVYYWIFSDPLWR